ncbi:MAG TPA: DUF1848 family protein [Chloroflexota bacterium]|nr:DUF1848 family protein [Chloroflexota bacterium]
MISASKRTDIPAFYLREMLRWCERGWVDVRNPYFGREGPTETAEQRGKRSTHVSLRPEDVIAIVWWSKNYAVYERLQEAFRGYSVQYFNFTINPRREDLAWLEPDVPPLEAALRQMDGLRRLPGGGEMIAWRYDPIVFWAEAGRLQSSWDVAFFERMCRDVAKLDVRRVITSIADPYLKFKQRLSSLFPERQLRQPGPDELQSITATMHEIAASFGVDVVGCSEPELSPFGIPHGACIDGQLLRAKSGDKASAKRATDVRTKGRETCGCAFHTDIGNYESHECGYSCLYCYANPNHRRFKEREG